MAKVGDKLLDIAEASLLPIESGCRMGMCGSDPVRIVEGEENLSAIRSAERRTLERFGLGAGCRPRGRTADSVRPDRVIVGGGLLGLEAAYYLAQLEVRVLVLDRGPWPLSRQLDEQAGALLWEIWRTLESRCCRDRRPGAFSPTDV
jgi:hypothetical protein